MHTHTFMHTCTLCIRMYSIHTQTYAYAHAHVNAHVRTHVLLRNKALINQLQLWGRPSCK